MPDPVPTAAELARVVAWLWARAAFLRRLAEQLGDEGSVYRNQANGLLFAAALERGEQP